MFARIFLHRLTLLEFLKGFNPFQWTNRNNNNNLFYRTPFTILLFYPPLREVSPSYTSSPLNVLLKIQHNFRYFIIIATLRHFVKEKKSSLFSICTRRLEESESLKIEITFRGRFVRRNANWICYGFNGFFPTNWNHSHLYHSILALVWVNIYYLN